jgi:hypothetical protein
MSQPTSLRPGPSWFQSLKQFSKKVVRRLGADRCDASSKAAVCIKAVTDPSISCSANSQFSRNVTRCYKLQAFVKPSLYQRLSAHAAQLRLAIKLFACMETHDFFKKRMAQALLVLFYKF